MKLNVQAIFDSIDGEENAFGGAGELTTFIRLKGCNLTCQWCDTKYAQNSDSPNWMTIDEVIQQVHFPKVTITGGEPLLQRVEVIELLNGLVANNCKVTVETNGTQHIPYRISSFLSMVHFVVDYKLPSSGMEDKMILEIFRNLCSEDVIKFVIADEKDYKRACRQIIRIRNWNVKKVFSPVLNFDYCGWYRPHSLCVSTEWPRKLVEMMIRDRIPAQFSLQLHKILWPGAKEER